MVMQLGGCAVLLSSGTVTGAQRDLQVNLAAAVLPSCLTQSVMHCINGSALADFVRDTSDKKEIITARNSVDAHMRWFMCLLLYAL